MRKRPLLLAVMALLSPVTAFAADKPASNPDEVYASNRAVDLEVKRSRDWAMACS